MENLTVPHCQQFGLMQFSLLCDEPADSSRQNTFQNITFANRQDCTKLVIFDMKMRRVVLIKIHTDYNA